MLDACPHHHEEENQALEQLTPRTPGAAKGKKFWRSLDELAQTPAFMQMLHREFPHAASEWKDGASRRNFLKLMGASLALGGLSACTMRKTAEKIVPYVNPPEEVIPGRPLFFASSMPWFGYAKGVIVESHEGRPTKIEGNVDHPASMGSSDVWMQASVLDLYDPDRSQVVMFGSSVSTWGAFTDAMSDALEKQKATQGAGLRFLTGAVTSPTIARQMQSILQTYPKARWHQHEPLGRTNCRMGANIALGRDVHSLYRFENADIVVALDSNFLVEDPASLVYARKFTQARKIRQHSAAKMNRLYAVESSVTLTGAMADHRLAIKSGEIESLGHDLAAAINGVRATGKNAAWINAVADDLKNNHGRSLIVVGESQPASLHALAHAMNSVLGNIGTTVTYIDPVEVFGPDGPRSLEELSDDARKGRVDLLVILGTNPAFTAAADQGYVNGENGDNQAFKQNPLAGVKMIVHHGMYQDETAFLSHWHIPASHFLESWGDLRAYDGTASIIQPLIYPLYSSKSDVELLGLITGQSDRGAYDMVRDTWKDHFGAKFETGWQIALEKGVIVNTAYEPVTTNLTNDLSTMLSVRTPTTPSNGEFEIVFRPDPYVSDGRYANNGWMQELPKPLYMLTWDNAAMMSVATAAKLQVEQKDPGRTITASVVELKYQGRTLRLPALIVPGHADESITICMGYGRSRAGRVGNGLGGNAYDIRTSAAPWFAGPVEVLVTSDTYQLATTQSHHLMESTEPEKLDTHWIEGRELIQTYTLDELKHKGSDKTSRTISLPLIVESDEAENKLIPGWPYENNKWGMVIDNNSCIGCNACVIACQSENNIPVVGKDQVLNDREMHWLRIDTYFAGEPEGSPEMNFQPIPCMQCENAPCELVCPVEATTHSAEGINEQTYNRCVGTRYCSNNCPYKVRRFNFFFFNDYKTQSTMLQKNPNVTVRGRGVMEKCNYCVQRINNGRIEAKKQDRPIAPGEVVPACAQSCPTQAITFGNLNDPKWDVVGLQDEPLRYTLLDELNTRPRTSYLAKVRNPNPALARS
jgi:MoCo/4Fe-4S cofactor protein with predicted Tat translocation signal